MQFLHVEVGKAFDFEETGWFGCIKTSPRKYAYPYCNTYYETEVGSILVSVSNVREAYGWELSVMREALAEERS